MTIKDKAYLALRSLGGRATEGQLVDKYIEMYPDYDKNHNPTDTTSKEKIRGTISAVLISNTQHENIKVDRSKKPFEYYIADDPNSLIMNQNIVIQPIGKNNSIEDFFEDNSTRWAEKIKYKKQWEKSENSIVLFIKDKEIFAIGTIAKIEEDKDDTYPLNYYYYDLTPTNNIDYNKILEYAERKGNFRHYELLDSGNNKAIIKYINSQRLMYLDDEHADNKFQDNINKIDAVEPEKSPQKIKDPKEINGIKTFPRNFAYAKSALEKSNYLCEMDNIHETFISNASNKNYMEAHHLIPLRVQEEFLYSLDVPANIIALCPNCHSKIHYGCAEDKKMILSTLLNMRKSELNIYGIDVTIDDLNNIYI